MKKSKLTIGRRLTVIVTLLGGFLAGSTVFNQYALQKTDRTYSEKLDLSIARLNGLQTIAVNVVHQRGAALDAMVAATTDEVNAAVSAFQSAAASVQAVYDQLDALPEDVRLTALRAEVEARRQPYRDSAGRMFAAYLEGQREVAERIRTGEFRPAMGRYLSAQSEYADACAAAATADSEAATHASTLLARTSLSVGLTATVGGAMLAFFFGRSIVRQVRDLAMQLRASADQTAAASGQVAASSQSLAEGSSEQAASIEEVSATMEQTAGLSRQNTENAQRARKLSEAARQAVEAGSAQMSELQTAMDGIRTAGTDISRIIKTIDEIAFQTNILALNAAVEAARAGGAGAGFAVVADEVRNLAQRAAQAARETSELIANSVSRSDEGAAMSGRVGESLAAILAQVREVDTLVGQIATASDEQSTGVGQVNTAMSQFDKVTQSTAAHAEETASAAEELSAQASELQAVSLRLLDLVVKQSPAETATVALDRAAEPASRKHPSATPAASPVPAPVRKQAPAVVAQRFRPVTIVTSEVGAPATAETEALSFR